MKNCQDCPSYLDNPSDIRSRLKKTTGAPICGRFGHILGSPTACDEQNTAIRQKHANECESFGEPLPPKPVSVSLRVAQPNMKIMGKPSLDDLDGTCRNCVNYIQASDVNENFGWGMALCAAKGTLIANERSAQKDCTYRTRKENEGDQWLQTHSWDEVEMMDHFKFGFRVATDTLVKSMTAHIDLLTPPSEYVSDAEVTEDDKAHGIRAWRVIKDPNGSAEAKLPIFDPAFFSEEERAKIPAHGSAEHPELYLDYNGLFFTFAVEAKVLGETPVLQANPGVGKTEFARSLAYAMQLPFERIVFRQRMDAESLLGSPQYDPTKGTYFQPGRLPSAWSKACVLLLDEPNLVEDDDVLHALRPLTDNSKQLVIEGASGDGQRGSWRFDRDDNCFLLLAQNPSWDPRNVGTRELASADANRLSVLTLEDPPDAIVREIVTRRCELDGYKIPADTLDSLIAISKDILALEEEGAFPDHWGTRQQIKVARKIPWYGVERAFKIAALDLYSPEVAALVMQSVASHVDDLKSRG